MEIVVGGVSGTFIRRKQEKGYECTSYSRYGIARCKFHEITEMHMLIHLKEYLKLLRENFYEDIEKIELDNTQNKSKTNREKLERKYNVLIEEYKCLLSQKIKDIAKIQSREQKEMIESAYKELENNKQSQIINLKEILSKEDKKILEDKKREKETAIEIFDQIISEDEPSKFLINSIIDKIIIYSDGTIEFILKGNIKGSKKLVSNIMTLPPCEL